MCAIKARECLISLSNSCHKRFKLATSRERLQLCSITKTTRHEDTRSPVDKQLTTANFTFASAVHTSATAVWHVGQRS